MIAALVALLLAEPLPLELSLRAGFAKAFGELESHPADVVVPSPMDNLVPLSVDIRYRLYRAVSLATSFEGAPALSCQNPSCSAAAFRVGLGLHLQPHEGDWRPFAALGLGYEWARRSFHGIFRDAQGQAADVKTTNTVQGVAWLVAQAGVEAQLTASLRLGPYVQCSIGKYSKEDTQESPPVEPAQSSQPVGVHAFVQAGLRLSFEP